MGKSLILWSGLIVNALATFLQVGGMQGTLVIFEKGHRFSAPQCLNPFSPFSP
jgi:hypothetical protein